MGRKLSKKVRKYQHAVDFLECQVRNREHIIEETRDTLKLAHDRLNAELARYQFIDRLLDEAFKYCEHYPLRAYIQGERQALSYPHEVLHMDHIQQMVALRGTFSGESPAKEAINTLQYYVMEIVNRNYGSPLYGVKPMICAHYRGQAVSYVQPESMKLLTKSQQYDIVMRELTPAVLAMIDKANC